MNNIGYYSPFYSEVENICCSSIVKVSGKSSLEIVFIISVRQVGNLLEENL